MQSARRVRPDFELQAADLDFLARVCRLTAGMPLALVLAAGWLDVLTLQQIASEIQQGIDILETELRDVPERQRSIRATFNYSWERLSDAEREVFMKLSVFRGGFTAEAAQAVAGANIRTLRRLVDKALVQALPTGRYEVHELLRQYGAEKLSQSGVGDAALKAWCTYFTDFMQVRAPDIKGRRQSSALDEIEADWNNVRMVWTRALAHSDYDTLAGMMEALYLFCDLRTHFREGEELFLQAVDSQKPKDGEAAHPVWIRLLLSAAAVLLLKESELPTDQEQIAEILTLAERYGDVSEDPFYLWVCGYALISKDSLKDAQDGQMFLKRSLIRYRALGDSFYVARALRHLASISINLVFGDTNDFTIYNRELLELTRATGDEMGMAHAIFYEGVAAELTNRPDEADRHLLEAEAIWYAGGDWKSVSVTKNFRARLALYKGDFLQARQLAEEGRSIALQVNYLPAKAMSSFIKVFSAFISGDNQLGTIYLKEYLSLYHNYFVLAIAACSVDDIQAAREYAQNLFTIVHTESKTWSSRFREFVMFNWLPFISIIIAHDGQRERAIELLGMVYDRHSNLTGWLEQWPRLTRLRAETEAELGSEAYAAAWERGEKLDSHTTFVKLLAEFSS